MLVDNAYAVFEMPLARSNWLCHRQVKSFLFIVCSTT